MAAKTILGPGELHTRGQKSSYEGFAHLQSLKESFTCVADKKASAPYAESNMISEIQDKIIKTSLIEIKDNAAYPSQSSMMDIVSDYMKKKGCDEMTALQSEEIKNSLSAYAQSQKIQMQSTEGLNKSGDVFYMVPFTGNDMQARLIWEATKNTMEQISTVVVLPQELQRPNSWNQHWARDFAASIGGKIYIPDPEIQMQQRNDSGTRIKQDTEALKATLKNAGLNIGIIELKDATFEGGNIKVNEQTKTIIVGTGGTGAFQQKTPDAFLNQVNATQETPYDLLPIKLQGNAYHLDLALSVLPRRDILAVRPYMDEDSYKRLEDKFGKENIVEITEQDLKDGYRYSPAANSTAVGKNILVMTDAPLSLRTKLEGRGYNVVTPVISSEDYSAQIKDDGVNCRVLELVRDVLKKENPNAQDLPLPASRPIEQPKPAMQLTQ